MALLETKGLNKSFGSVIAAADITVSIEDREIVGVIGANGAGKTTFVNMVTGYLKPDSGQIVYRNRDITSLAPREITKLGICRSFQVPQVFTSLPVSDNLLIALGVAQEGFQRFWRPLHRKDLAAAADEIIERYSMGEYRNPIAGQLPQGVRKLMDIAMAMCSNPKVLLLDEPTSGVSVDEKFVLMDLVMGALKDTGVTLLFIEHDMDIVERYSQRVLAFYDGSIIADGAPDTVLGEAKVREFVIGEALHTPPREEGGSGHA